MLHWHTHSRRGQYILRKKEALTPSWGPRILLNIILQILLTLSKKKLLGRYMKPLKNKVLGEIFGWVLNMAHTWGCYNQYMYIVDIYWYFKLLLGVVFLNQNEAKE